MKRLISGPALAAACVLVSGCSTIVGPYRPLSDKTAAGIATVDVLTVSPQRNLRVTAEAGGVYAQPGPGVSVGAAVGIGIVVNLVAAGVTSSRMSGLESSLAPLAQHVGEYRPGDELLVAIAAGGAGPRWSKVTAHGSTFPVDPQSLKVLASQGAGDATVVVSFESVFPLATKQPLAQATVRVFRKDGVLIAVDRLAFSGPAPPKLDDEDLARWWIDADRYRTLLRLAVRGFAAAIRREFVEPAKWVAEAEVEPMLETIRLDGPRSLGLLGGFRATPMPDCALDVNRRVRYLFIRTAFELYVRPECEGETQPADEPIHARFLARTDWYPALGAWTPPRAVADAVPPAR